MEVIQTFPNGTTIEVGEDSWGKHVHRVCNHTGSLCRYTESWHIAIGYAHQYEEYFVKNPKK